MNPDQLKNVFSDALRWQLQRIIDDQVASSSPAIDHASLDYRYAEAWTCRSGASMRNGRSMIMSA
ncbi:hypothetical protein [Sphingomonas sp. 2SG]|uniref:hypothetical protein n=1 Tax=Sphingomonas sp. 2SG TaxID=2502201 RepID=UPI0010F4556E|nr:hypothetical protein [Sphingomonas sp. 2SG]